MTEVLENDRDRSKKEYLEKAAERYADALRLHERSGGLWDKDEEGKDWRNVTEHCLMEAVRAEIFAEKLGLGGDVARDLCTAAALHDFYKKIDIQYTREDVARGGSGRMGNLRSEKEAAEILARAGYGKQVIWLVGSVGGDPETLIGIKDILDKRDLPDEEAAYITMHYIDDYTAGSDWAGAAENGKNDIDKRMEKNASNPDYRKMDHDVALFAGNPYFKGMTRYEAQAAIGHLIEQRLAKLIKEKSGENIAPIMLPEAIDRAIRSKMEK